jgi:hypothetical protein
LQSLGFGLDAGLQMQTGEWRFGLSARDITTTLILGLQFYRQEKEATLFN